jgi:ABC-type glycerol-3-phosphate transport system permease component
MSTTGNRINAVALIAVLTAGTVVMLGPIVLIFLSAFKTGSEIVLVPPKLLPDQFMLDNYAKVFASMPFGRYFFNSVFVVGSVTSVGLLVSSLAGYVFGKFEFPGKNLFYFLVLATIMIPLEVIVVPLFLVVRSFRWINSYWALIVPFIANPFGIFLMRQFMHTVPNSLIDSARIDGCSEVRIFWSIILPVVKPALAVLAIYTFWWNWNIFIWPLVVVSSTEMRTLPLGIANLFTYKGSPRYDLLMAASSLAILPVVTVFLVFQRHFVKGITLTGMKM